jgi:hypothetical protein
MNNIDLTYLKEISGGDDSFIREMLDLFINTTAIEVNEFDHHLAVGDYIEIKFQLATPYTTVPTTNYFSANLIIKS